MDALEVTFNFSKEMATGLGTHEIIQSEPHVSRKNKSDYVLVYSVMFHFVLEKITIWLHESETRDTCMWMWMSVENVSALGQ